MRGGECCDAAASDGFGFGEYQKFNDARMSRWFSWEMPEISAGVFLSSDSLARSLAACACCICGRTEKLTSTDEGGREGEREGAFLSEQSTIRDVKPA